MIVSQNNLQRVKIARVSTVTFIVETQLRGQIGAIVKAGADVTIVASEGGLEQEILGSRYVSIDIPRKIHLVRDCLSLIRLYLFFRRSGFQIVHSTTPKAGLLCCLAAKFAGVPVRIHTFTGQPWVSLTGIKKILSKGSDKLIAYLNTHCYADSPSQMNFLVDSGVSGSEQISVLGSGSLAGIDLNRFNSDRFNEDDKNRLKKELGIPVAAKILLFVGRLSRDKGIVELLQAYQKLLVGQKNTRLILLGPAEMNVNSLLNGFNSSVRQHVIIHGFSKEPERFMAIADMLVLPSYREGFGTVVIEAAAMGVPTIGANIYGLSDAIVDGETGLLVALRDVDELARAMDLLLKDSSFRRNLGLNAWKRAQKEFSDKWLNEVMIAEYVRFITQSTVV